jgi:hypothetical protein
MQHLPPSSCPADNYLKTMQFLCRARPITSAARWRVILASQRFRRAEARRRTASSQTTLVVAGAYRQPRMLYITRRCVKRTKRAAPPHLSCYRISAAAGFSHDDIYASSRQRFERDDGRRAR